MDAKKLAVQEDPAAFIEGSRGKSSSLIMEYFVFLKSSGKWWMLPLFGLLLVGGLLVVLAGTSAAPFIYALF